MIWWPVAAAVPVEQAVRDLVPEVVAHVQEQTGQTFSSVPTVVVTDRQTETAASGEAPPPHYAALYDQDARRIEIYWDAMGAKATDEVLACVLAHELTHALQHQVLGEQMRQMDPYLREGHAVQTASDLCEAAGWRYHERAMVRHLGTESYRHADNDGQVYAWGARMVGLLTDSGPWPTWIAQPIPDAVWNQARPNDLEVRLEPPWPTRAEQRRICAGIGPWREPQTRVGAHSLPHERVAVPTAGRHAIRSWRCGQVQFHALVAEVPSVELSRPGAVAGPRWTFTHEPEGTVATLAGSGRGLRVEIPSTVAARPLSRQLKRRVRASRWGTIELEGTGERDQTWWYQSTWLGDWVGDARDTIEKTPALAGWSVVPGDKPQLGPFLLDVDQQQLVVAATFPMLPYSGDRSRVAGCALQGLAAVVDDWTAAEGYRQQRAWQARALHEAIERCDSPTAAATLRLQQTPFGRWLVDHPQPEPEEVEAFFERERRRWELGGPVETLPPGGSPLGRVPVDDPAVNLLNTRMRPLSYGDGRLVVWEGDVDVLLEAVRRTEGARATPVDAALVAPDTEDVIVWFRLDRDRLARLHLAGGVAWEPVVAALRALGDGGSRAGSAAPITEDPAAPRSADP